MFVLVCYVLFCFRTEEEKTEAARRLEEWKEEKRRIKEQEEKQRLAEEIQKRRQAKVLVCGKKSFNLSCGCFSLHILRLYWYVLICVFMKIVYFI